MKVVLFGANGATGRLLTGQMIDAGHSALAVTRRPREFPFTDPQLTVAAADVRDESTLAGVTDGADAVVSAIGVPFTRQSFDIEKTGGDGSCARCSSEPASAVAEADEDPAHTSWPPQHFGSAVAAEVQTTGLRCC